MIESNIYEEKQIILQEQNLKFMFLTKTIINHHHIVSIQVFI
jgi:hypothetical protein